MTETLEEIRGYLRKIWILLLLVLVIFPVLAGAAVLGITFLGRSASDNYRDVGTDLRSEELRKQYTPVDCYLEDDGIVTEEECNRAFGLQD